MISRVVFALASFLVAGCVSAEEVANVAMAQCDGLGTRVRVTPDSRQGVSNCTVALTQLEATNPDNWTRKISILQSRALHRLVGEDFDGALGDLDEADKTAATPNIYYQRSLGLNTQLIRALALRKKGDEAASETLAVKAQALRPYSRDAALAALTVISLDGDQKTIDDILTKVARVHPNLSDLPFKNYFETGRFEQALAIADGLRPSVIPERQTYDMRTLISREEGVRASDAVFWIDVDGHRAFALAALGRKDDALAALAGAEKRIAAAKVALQPLPAKPTEEQTIRRIVQDDVNRQVDADAKPVLDFWTKLTQAKLAKNNNDLAGAIKIMKDVKMESATLAVFEFDAGAESEARKKLLAESGALRAVAVGLPPPSPKLMFEFLLHPEYPSTIEQGIDPLTGLFMSDDDKARGGCGEGKTKEGFETICFKSLKTAPNMAEEQAILRAADRAIAKGAVSFVIERRMDIRYSVTTTQYGMALGTYDDGYESRLDVRFFKAGEPGADCWRCLKAADVRSNLAPIYRPVASAKH